MFYISLQVREARNYAHVGYETGWARHEGLLSVHDWPSQWYEYIKFTKSISSCGSDSEGGLSNAKLLSVFETILSQKKQTFSAIRRRLWQLGKKSLLNIEQFVNWCIRNIGDKRIFLLNFTIKAISHTESALYGTTWYLCTVCRWSVSCR